jgi:hypothetical protein
MTSRKLHIFFKLSAWLTGCIAAILAAGYFYEQYIRTDCRLPITAENAKAAIERDLSKPSASALLGGKQPKIFEIALDVNGFTEPRKIPSRTFKFRLVGTSPDQWGYAIYDACGYVELAGDFAGRYSKKN